MMELCIRRASSKEYDRLAVLLNAVDDSGITGDSLRDWDTRLTAEDIHRRYVASLAGAVIGYGVVYKPASAQNSRFLVWVTVDAAHRGQGHGARFYDELARIARNLGATSFSSECRDDDPIALAFAERRGFVIRRHLFQSELYLSNIDLAPLLPLVEQVRAQGIHFTSLAHEGETDEALYKLYVLNTQTSLDNPSDDGTYRQTFEQFQQSVVKACWFRPGGQILAVDGDRYVGLAAIGISDDGANAFNAYTGVDAEYRGRKIAQALKVLGVQFAINAGAQRLRTSNDSENAPMLAVNDRLGYRRLAGVYALVKREVPSLS
jgi:GNAT superfamily N-acetyltransferase